MNMGGEQGLPKGNEDDNRLAAFCHGWTRRVLSLIHLVSCATARECVRMTVQLVQSPPTIISMSRAMRLVVTRAKQYSQRRIYA